MVNNTALDFLCLPIPAPTRGFFYAHVMRKEGNNGEN